MGTSVEFERPGTFPPLTTIRGGGPFSLKAGEWTDDTSMALCLAESLVERDGFDPVDQMQRYLRWRDEGYMGSNGTCFDIGVTIGAALARFESTHSPWCGVADANQAGNGSLMRLAPVPLFFSGQPETAIERAGESSRTTHAAAATIDACRYMGALIVGALQGRAKEKILAPRFSPIAGYWESHPLCADINEVAMGSFRRREPPDIKGTSYVVKSLEAALWAFCKSDSFEKGCLIAANLGNDADSTAAVYGQLAGAYYGESGIPAAWRGVLAKNDLITSLADKLYAAMTSHTRLPFERSYWVVPGSLLAGAYPGAPDREEELRKLQSLINVGVTMIVNLMEPNERGTQGRPLRQYGYSISELARACGVDIPVLQHPIRDVGITTVDHMRRILDDIDAGIERGKVVYVHCLGGRGRTGTVIGCWLVRHGLASPDNAVEEIERLRVRTKDAGFPSPETPEQTTMVESWREGQ